MKIVALFVQWYFRIKFNKLVINSVDVKPGHSYLLMCNHFSFLDGFAAYYLCGKVIQKKLDLQKVYTMILKKQLQKNPYFQYANFFSIAPGSPSVNESLAYAAELLRKPGNVVLIYPQGNLESNHVRNIVMKDGIAHIIPLIKGDCQLLWSSNLIEYFESVKPSVYFHMLDCGTNHEFDFEKLSQKINTHHKEAIKKQFRFTED